MPIKVGFDIGAETLAAEPDVGFCHDSFGNICGTPVASAGVLTPTTSFGRMELKKFVVISDEVVAA